ncbi:MAG: hypothetical protein DRR04_01825 [Gammaproteobacteria bacterium]|nr:MAG: hypothetical protein DRR04_01825 [Gammaproteobacteria bacterium]
MPERAKYLAVFILLTMITACADTPVVQEQPSTEFAAEGLHPVSSSGFEAAYARPNANLASYRTLDVVSMDVSDVHISHTTAPGTMRRDWQIMPERKTNLQGAWDRAMNRAFAGYAHAGTGDKELRITAKLTRLEPGRTSAAAGHVSGMAGTSTDTVDVSAEFRLYDQAGGDLLAVVRDRRTIAMLQWTRAAGTDMVNLFNSWAALLHTRVSGK